MHGFNQPHLLGQLAEVGINVHSVIKISSEDYSRFEPKAPVDEATGDLPPPPPVEKDDRTLGMFVLLFLIVCYTLNDEISVNFEFD